MVKDREQWRGSSPRSRWLAGIRASWKKKRLSYWEDADSIASSHSISNIQVKQQQHVSTLARGPCRVRTTLDVILPFPPLLA